MPKITLTPSFVALMQKKDLLAKTLLLITDDGGGRYSLQGGACSIGTKFTLIVLAQLDPAYDVALTNDAGLQLYTSGYDMIFLSPGLKLDFADGRISLKDNAHASLDNSVLIADGQEVLAAFKQGLTVAGQSC